MSFSDYKYCLTSSEPLRTKKQKRHTYIQLPRHAACSYMNSFLGSISLPQSSDVIIARRHPLFQYALASLLRDLMWYPKADPHPSLQDPYIFRSMRRTVCVFLYFFVQLTSSYKYFSSPFDGIAFLKRKHNNIYMSL